MAEKASSTKGVSLVIVESPAKARTIARFLGQGFIIEASIGHVRNLPQAHKEIPAAIKNREWAYLGVDVNNRFEPVYIIPSDKKKQVQKLKQALKDAKDLYLATDEDREGEAISWHSLRDSQPQSPCPAFGFPRDHRGGDPGCLAAPPPDRPRLSTRQEARRILDRLYGYEVSPLLWRKVRPKLSAGRVQSVAVRLIVDRERERMRFVAADYWDLLGTFAKESGEEFRATLVSLGGKRLPSGRDFDPSTGKLKDPALLLLDARQARDVAERLLRAASRVAQVQERPYVSKPYPPFTTSTLQQEANRKLGFTARKTMQLAQSLYENGHITYMRTDSTNLAAVAISAARDLIADQYGPEYLPDQPRTYATKVKNAQEAHEAIRPAGHPFGLPETLRSRLGGDEFRLYDLIWKRTIASQMRDARGHSVTITVAVEDARFEVKGTTIEFPGYLRAYVEGSDDPEAQLADRESILPSVQEGEPLVSRALEPKGHTTQPPNRYSEAALTRALEEKGIGRPSTYAAIIDTILGRNYVFKRNNVLVPTWTAFAVCQLLERHFPELVDYEFTAQMEEDLDAISRGEMEHVDYLKAFYFGNGHPGLKPQLVSKQGEIDARDVSRVLIGTPDREGTAADPIYVDAGGRYGPRVIQGDRRANVPESMAPR